MADNDTPKILTVEMRESLKSELKQIEDTAFAKGVAAGRGGHADSNVGLAAKLADRAAELQKTYPGLTNEAAVRRAYSDAGVPLQ